MPSTNGHATARAVARIYSALAGEGEVDGVRILAPETIAEGDPRGLEAPIGVPDPPVRGSGSVPV